MFGESFREKLLASFCGVRSIRFWGSQRDVMTSTSRA